MDKHDVAHYGIAGALVAALGAGGAYFVHAQQKTWPTLTDKQAVDIIKNVGVVLGKDQPVNVYCIDRECNKIARQLRAAGRSINVAVKTDRPWSSQDGVSVGGKTDADAEAIKSAVEHYSDGLLRPEAIPNQPPYISFGHFVDDEK